MRLILIGPPGSGKGTQAKLLCDRLHLVAIGTGDILREAIRAGTPAGARAEPFLVKGRLVPDDLVNELVADRLRRPDQPEHFLMDGYPRTVAQANALDRILRKLGLDLTAAVVLEVSDDEIVRRLTGRWTCPRCQATYHMDSKPPHEFGKCDECGETLVQRADDREETVRERLRVYRTRTAGLVPHYRAKGLLREVPGTGDIEQIYSNILKALHR